MVSAAELRELEAERIRAEIAARKAQASKFRAEGTYLRRKDAKLKLDQEDIDASTYEQRILEYTKEVTEESVDEAITILSEWRARGKDSITIRITSPGGSSIHGFALYDYILSLRSEGIKVDTVALGWAASMAGILLQAGTKRYIALNAHMLIHEVAVDGLPWMKLNELKDELELLDSIQSRIATILAERSTLSVAEVSKRMKRKDWWLDAEKVVELGFADGLWPPKTKRGR